MDPRRDTERRELAARCLIQRVRRRATMNEAVGVLQVWRGCGQQQAREAMRADHGATGQDAEAVRVIAVVNEAADGRTDPDSCWE